MQDFDQNSNRYLYVMYFSKNTVSNYLFYIKIMSG